MKLATLILEILILFSVVFLVLQTPEENPAVVYTFLGDGQVSTPQRKGEPLGEWFNRHDAQVNAYISKYPEHR